MPAEYLYKHFLKEVSNIPRFDKLFVKETDRGCALLAASLIDLELTRLFRSLFIPNEKIIKSVLSGNGGLATLSSKIDLCYLLGCCSKKDYNKMHIIRKIRNQFGHTFDDLTFTEKTVVQQLKSISLKHHKTNTPPRQIFIDVAVKIVIGIYVEVLHAHINPEPEYFDFDPVEFIKYKSEEKKLPKNKS